jgi:hypothetical protein
LGSDYKGGMTIIKNGTIPMGIEIYTPNGIKIKTFDTVKIDVNGNIIIGGDTVINIIGALLQSGKSEYMIGKSDGSIKDGLGNIISDEVISAEITACENMPNQLSIGKQKKAKKKPVLFNNSWVSYSKNNDTLHIKNGTQIIGIKRTHFSNIDKVPNNKAAFGKIRLDSDGKIKLPNGSEIIAPKNTIIDVEYESGECIITIGDSNAIISNHNGIEEKIIEGTVLNSKGEFIKDLS